MLRAGRIVFLLAGFIFAMMMITSLVSEAATCSISIDGVKVSSDADPIIVDERTLVPASVIVDNLGGKSSWNQEAGEATFTYDGTVVKVKIGSKTATVNGVSETLDVAPRIVTINAAGGGRTMVPLRFIGEKFGYDVSWDNSTRTVVMTSPVVEPSVYISSIDVSTGQKVSSSSYTNITVKASSSLKAIAGRGVMLTDPYRFYIDFESASLTGNAGASKKINNSASPVSEVRTGNPQPHIVRIVADLNSAVTPAVSYSTDGKTMTISFKESENSSGSVTEGGSQTPSQNENNSNSGNTGDTGNTGSTGNNNEAADPEIPEVTGNDTLTDNNTVKHDTLADYKPFADGKITVCIDPGHGDTTGGKRSPDGTLLEWEFNRDVAYRLKSLLEQQGYSVIMTVGKTESGDPSLKSRAAVANNAGNVDLFVSIHSNANGNGKSWDSAKGWEVYAYKLGGVSEIAAKFVEKATVAAIPEFKDRGVKSASFSVIRNSEMPAILIEHGFFTNQEECQLLKDSAFRQRLAQADCTGIVNFFNSLK